ncbi:hypothetical protein [Pseudomonas sp. Irchel 3A7]|uniref:hypothetical protein n=1 Tax=Pseudomonas sp. Irchel 3A7 TaxID=2008913 RepID=UPI00113FC4E8|nr:hypothetical protein [Pseudomonas sp. Irchel 3A7]
MSRPDSELDPIVGSLAPVVEFYCPIAPGWPRGASTLPAGIMEVSNKALFLRLPTFATLLTHPGLIGNVLEQYHQKILDKLKSEWSFNVYVVNNQGELPEYIKNTCLQITGTQLPPEDLDVGFLAIEKAVDNQLMHIQIGMILNERILDESYVAANISPKDVVEYEISKHYQPLRLKPDLCAILAQHRHAFDTSANDHQRIDHLFAGYQTAAAIERLDGYSAEVVANVAFFRAGVMSDQMSKQVHALSARKKSVFNFHLLTTDEGMAELHSFLSLDIISKVPLCSIHFAMTPEEAISQLPIKIAAAIADMDSPYGRGLTFYKRIYDMHGFAFCMMSKQLCENYLRCLVNYIPLYMLKGLNSSNFPYHPTVLLDRLQSFDHPATNACAKVAAAVSYLGLDAESPQEYALKMLRRQNNSI